MSDTSIDGQGAAVRPKREFGRLILIGGSALILAMLLLFYLIYRYYQAEMDQLLNDSARDYSRAPFNMVDAREHCQRRTQHRYGSKLAMSYVDEHSTRIDQKTGMYKVFLFVRIGNLTNYEEETIHCFIDPVHRVLTHYRTINLRKASRP